jgi:hypothetical protein
MTLIVMFKSLTFIDLLTILNVTPCKAQLSDTEKKEILTNADIAISNIHTVVYIIELDNKSLSKRDTIKTTAICSLQIVHGKLMRSHHNIDLEFVENGKLYYGHRRYDGIKTLWTNYYLSDINNYSEPSIYSKNRENKAVVSNYRNLLMPEYFVDEHIFKLFASQSEMINITEGTLFDEPVYIVEIHYADTEDYHDSISKHFIRESDYLPVAYHNTVWLENMVQYNYYTVSYLAINQKLPEEIFTVNEDERINAKQRYENFKEMVIRSNAANKP